MRTLKPFSGGEGGEVNAEKLIGGTHPDNSRLTRKCGDRFAQMPLEITAAAPSRSKSFAADVREIGFSGRYV